MEAWDTLATLEEGVGRLAEPAGVTAAALEPLVVVAHRLKGAAALHGFPGLSQLAGVTEALLERAPEASPEVRRRLREFLGDLAPVLKTVLDGIEATAREDDDAIAAFQARHPDVFTAPATAAPPGGATGAGPAGLFRELDRFFAENADILTYFAPEAAEHLEVMSQALLALEREGRREDELATLFRAVHTFKGAAYTVGCTAVGDLAHRIEDVLGAVREGCVPLTPAVIEAVFAGVDALRLFLASAGGAPAELPKALERALAELTALAPSAEPAAVPAPEAPPEPALAAAEPAASPATPEPAASMPARRAAPGGPAIRVNPGRLDALMNLVGELVIARSRLERRLRELDRVGGLLLASRARMARAVRDLEGRPHAPLLPRPEAPDAEPLTQLFAELEFDRYDDFDILARSVAEISADLAEVQSQLAGLIRAVWEDTGQIQRLTGSLRSEVTRARMVPVGRLFARFARHVREAARAAGKRVVLEVSGESAEVDNTIIEQIADPLLHLVRNAIAHGIEPEEERHARGKPPHGTVYLSASHRGGFIYVEVEDDGWGIDGGRLTAEAVRQGFLRAEVAPTLSPREALGLIFLPGFSTAGLVTAAAGRGVGLDVVRTNVSRLNGEIEVETEVGVGTRFTLKLPLTVVISDALMVRAGSETLAIPLNAVRVIRKVRADEIQTVGRAELVRVDEELVDLYRLERLLALPPTETNGRVSVVVLRAGGKSAAVAVSELLGKEEIVIKSLGGFLDGVGPFAGATISGDGRVILLLDPARLVEAAEGVAAGAAVPTRPAAAARSTPGAAPRVLLVDDSVSVRRFVGHMLERAGFELLTANDGAEALARLAETTVDVVITDLEMPRVNGYELVADLRRRPSTREVPVVVLTTRAGEKHLSLARRLGVQHYVSKPVDEHAFLRLVAALAAPAAAAAVTGAAR